MLNTIPRIGYGTWALSGDISKLVYEAIKCGYRHIDCAEIYKNQDYVGKGMQQALNENLCKREDLWVTSKIWNDKHTPEKVRQSCEQTLKDLKLQYLDLLLIHWPIATTSPDQIAKVPLSQTWSAMEKLVDDGLVKKIGVSNFDMQLLHDLLSYCRIRPYTNQIECHPYLAQKVMLEYCEKEKIYLTCYSPLARQGSKGDTQHNLDESSCLKECAKAHQKTVPQIVLKWALQRSQYTVIIPKTSTLARLPMNLDLNFNLREEDMKKIDQLDCHGRLIETPGPIKVFS